MGADAQTHTQGPELTSRVSTLQALKLVRKARAKVGASRAALPLRERPLLVIRARVSSVRPAAAVALAVPGGPSASGGARAQTRAAAARHQPEHLGRVLGAQGGAV